MPDSNTSIAAAPPTRKACKILFIICTPYRKAGSLACHQRQDKQGSDSKSSVSLQFIRQLAAYMTQQSTRLSQKQLIPHLRTLAFINEYGI
jgi:hypothetical protein